MTGRAGWLFGGLAVGAGFVVATRSARASTARPSPSPATTPGAVAVIAPSLPTAGPRLVPLVNARLSPTGDFGSVRTPGHGNCRSGRYPCTHRGWDLVPASYYRGPIVEDEWHVRAPEDLIVDLVVVDDDTPPLSGYGPGAVLAVGRSGVWHIFGHLSPRSFPRGLVTGATIARGQVFARVAPGVRPPHVHWEIRRWRTEAHAAPQLGRAATRADIVIDPRAWLGGEAPAPLRNRGASLVYRPVGARGDRYPAWVQALRGKSGVYVIRERDTAGDPVVVYVGESHTDRLYETLTRHFQDWRRYKGFWRGQYAEGHDPGMTYPRDRVEVATRVMSGPDAIDEERRLIRRLNPRDNLIGQPEDAPF